MFPPLLPLYGVMQVVTARSTAIEMLGLLCLQQLSYSI